MKLVSIKLCALLLLATMSKVVFAADTKCYIYISGDCHGMAPSYTWFEDNYKGSAKNNGICLHRAREYRQYCAMPPEAYVNAAFNLDGVTINAQKFYGPGKVSTFGLGWQPLVTE